MTTADILRLKTVENFKFHDETIKTIYHCILIQAEKFVEQGGEEYNISIAVLDEETVKEINENKLSGNQLYYNRCSVNSIDTYDNRILGTNKLFYYGIDNSDQTKMTEDLRKLKEKLEIKHGFKIEIQQIYRKRFVELAKANNDDANGYAYDDECGYTFTISWR